MLPPTTSFIGRKKEFADLQQLLNQPDCRLLTIVGPGGIGKTRLASKLAEIWANQGSTQTAVVPLHPLRSADFFITALADAVDFSLGGPEPPLQQVADLAMSPPLISPPKC